MNKLVNDIDILVPESEIVKVQKRDYLLGELSLIQTIKVCKFIAKTIFINKEKLDELAKRTKETKNNVEDILIILELLDEEKVPELFGIILKENDIEFLHQNLTPSNTLEILAILCERNDFLSLKKNIKRIMAMKKTV